MPPFQDSWALTFVVPVMSLSPRSARTRIPVTADTAPGLVGRGLRGG